jgi:hypothetical protein
LPQAEYLIRKRQLATAEKIILDLRILSTLERKKNLILLKEKIIGKQDYPGSNGVKILTDIEGGNKGVKEKEIKIDITNCDWMPRHWKNYKPVYSYAEDPNSLFGVVWHRIENTKLRKRTFSFTQKFESDSAWVALRYPYSYTRQRRFIECVKGNENVDIEELGKTVLGFDLTMIVITDKAITSNDKKGVLVYAREHGVEQDGSWVAEGVIDFLLSSEPLAYAFRQQFITIVIPILSPDSVISGHVVDPTTGNTPSFGFLNGGTEAIEAKLLYTWLNNFVQKGNTLAISISLHNPHGTEPNFYPYYHAHNSSSLLGKAKHLHKAILQNCKGYTKWKQFSLTSCACLLGSFVRDFGSIAILYEVNHQARNNYLSLQRLKGMGKMLVSGIANFYGLKL